MTKLLLLLFFLPAALLAQTPAQNSYAQAATILQGAPAPRSIPKRPDIPLMPSAAPALNLQKDWQDGDPLPAPGENGTVVFTYGAAMPPIICAPERLTTIFLEKGERVQNPPVLGDTFRWEYQLMTAGEGPNARTSIVLKPRRPNIETDLAVTTNKRSYQLALQSRPSEHLSMVEFSYPNELQESWFEYQAQQKKLEAERDKAIPLEAHANFAYTVQVSKKSSPPFVPKAVYDDTHHTYLKMPPQAKDWSTAVLQTAGPNGCEIVNYRVAGDTWVIDRLFNSAELVSGTGKTARRVIITRDGSPKDKCGSSNKKNIVAKLEKK